MDTSEANDDYLTPILSSIGLKRYLNDFSPYFLVSNAKTFLNLNWETLQVFISAFHQIVKRPQFLDELFQIDKIINTGSVNGDIVILSVKKESEFPEAMVISPKIDMNTLTLEKSTTTPQILLKVPKKKTSDPISYEYYIGLSLNTLREFSPYQSFAVTYGLLTCNIDLSSNRICGTQQQPEEIKRSGIFYEFIQSHDVSQPTITLTQYIDSFTSSKPTDENSLARFNLNLINILKYVLLSLEYAQINLEFTHYDLHLSNIILIKNKDISPVQISYTDAETGAVDYFNLEMEYTPIIIDYGRSYINSDKAVSLTNQTFINHDKNKGYLSFKDMTEDLWPGQKFRHRERSILIRVQKMIESLSPKYDMDYLTILNNYFDATDNSIASGIDPKIFHPMYDAYRFTRTLSSHLVNACLNNMIHIDSMWFKLTRVLSDNYPFYVPYYFGLATVYPPFPSKAYSNYTCMRPFDIVYLCDLLKSNSIKYQIGGGGGKEPVLLKLNDNFKKQKMPVSPPDTLPPTDSVGKGTDNVAANLEGIDLLVVNDKPDFDVPLPTSSNYKFFSKTASFELQNALFQIPKNFFKKQN